MLKCTWRSTLIFVLVLGLSAVPASAQPVFMGLDLLSSQPGTAADFSDNPLPTNFFGCGETFNGRIELGGKRIAASQPLGTTDTILARWDDVPLGPPGSTGTTTLQIVGLCLKHDCWSDPCGNVWKVLVRLDPTQVQPMTTLDMTVTSPTGGVFDAMVSVLADVTFTNGSIVLGPVTDNIDLLATGACWNYAPAPGDVIVFPPLDYDSTCDGFIDTTVPLGTSNFFHCGPVTHSGPHPTEAAEKCEEHTTTETPEPWDLTQPSETDEFTTEKDCDSLMYNPACN